MHLPELGGSVGPSYPTHPLAVRSEGAEKRPAWRRHKHGPPGAVFMPGQNYGATFPDAIHQQLVLTSDCEERRRYKRRCTSRPWDATAC
jgi:hypothetical protein